MSRTISSAIDSLTERAFISFIQYCRTPYVDSQCSRVFPEARMPTCAMRLPRPMSSLAW